jgi:general secretion pathway protein D
VLTRNNQLATITVGEEVPFIRNSRITQDGQIINTVEYEDIGIILTVTPFINPDGLVEMELYTEISTITGDTVPISDNVNAPVFAKRSAETMVVAPDGKTVVIGGLMEDNLTESTSKVPILGDIPVLGFPFRRTIKSKGKTELLIFLTPYVVRSEAELREMSRTEKNRTELAPQVFPDEKMNKYIENLED